MEFWKEIIVTLSRNRWRSFMTMFGVFWGIWMLIVLSGIGDGIRTGILPDMDRIPTNSAFVFTDVTTEPYRGFGVGRYWRMRIDDIDAIARQFEGKVKTLAAVLYNRGTTFTHGDNTGRFGQRGVNPAFYKFQPNELVYGRHINDVDMAERRKVCVIGTEVYETLFPEGGDPTGSYISAGGLYFMVVGVVRQTSEKINIGGRIRNVVMLPLTTQQQCYNRGHDIDFLIINFADNCPAAQYQDQVGALLRQRHLIAPNDKGAVEMFNLQEEVDMFNNLFLGINILLVIVGLGMLMGGLIGISNIVLVTVKERTQEIGVRRAIGAKPRLILIQIMSESLLLTATSGIVGLVLGVWTLSGLDAYLQKNETIADMPIVNPHVTFAFAAVALIVIIVGGLLAGWMPARRAMKIKPIEALREE